MAYISKCKIEFQINIVYLKMHAHFARARCVCIQNFDYRYIAINIRVGIYSIFRKVSLGCIKIVKCGLGPEIDYVRRHETSCKDWHYTRASGINNNNYIPNLSV